MVTFQQDHAERTSTGGPGDPQEYAYRANPEAEVEGGYLDQDGRYRTSKTKFFVYMDSRRKYVCPEF